MQKTNRQNNTSPKINVFEFFCLISGGQTFCLVTIISLLTEDSAELTPNTEIHVGHVYMPQPAAHKHISLLSNYNAGQ